MKAFKIDGILYNKASIAGLRETLIDIRDEELKQNDFDRAVFFSHIVMLLSRLQEEMED